MEAVPVFSWPVRGQGGQHLVLSGRCLQAEKEAAGAAPGQAGAGDDTKVPFLFCYDNTSVCFYTAVDAEGWGEPPGRSLEETFVIAALGHIPDCVLVCRSAVQSVVAVALMGT